MSPIADNGNDAYDISSSPTESIPFKIPMGIIERIMDARYAGDGSVHPSAHLLKLTELCELFKVAGLSQEEIMKKLFPLSLKDNAKEWYELLGNFQHSDWREIESLFNSKFYPLHEIHLDRNYVYNFLPHDGESITDTHKYRGSLKSSLGSITQIYSSTRWEHKNTNKTLAIEASLSTTHIYQ